MCPAHDWNVKSQDKMEIAGFCECLTSKAFLRDTREIVCFAILSYLLHYILTHTIYTIITHKCWGVLLREILATNLKSQRLLYPQFFTQLLVGFPQLLPLHFHTIERLIAQTLTIPFQSVQWDFGATGKYWKKPGFGGCNRAYCRIRRARQDMVPRSLVRIGV